MRRKTYTSSHKTISMLSLHSYVCQQMYVRIIIRIMTILEFVFDKIRFSALTVVSYLLRHCRSLLVLQSSFKIAQYSDGNVSDGKPRINEK